MEKLTWDEQTFQALEEREIERSLRDKKKKSLYQFMITKWLCLVHAIQRYFPVCFLKPPTYTLRSFIHKEALVAQSVTAI